MLHVLINKINMVKIASWVQNPVHRHPGWHTVLICTYVVHLGLPMAQLPSIEGYNPTGRPFIVNLSYFSYFLSIFSPSQMVCADVCPTVSLLGLPKPCVFAGFVQVLLPIRRSLAEEGAAEDSRKRCVFSLYGPWLDMQRHTYIIYIYVCILYIPQRKLTWQ